MSNLGFTYFYTNKNYYLERNDKMTKVSKTIARRLFMIILAVFVSTSVLVSFPLGQIEQTQAATKTVTVAAGTKYATPLYVIDSGKPGPVVMIVGGVHGNEPAGYMAAAKFKNTSIKNGKLLVLPQANKRAVANNTRSMGGADLNRAFPRSKNDSADNSLSKAIFKVVKDYDVDWLMDMHEGTNYNRLSSTSSVGQSVIYYPDAQTRKVAVKIVNSLNSNIKTSYKKYSLLRYPAKGSLARASAVVCGSNTFIVETCWKDPLSTRINNQVKAANILLKNVGMK